MTDERIPRYDAPTLAELEPLRSNTVNAEVLETIRKVLAGEVNPCDVAPECAAWVASCHNTPEADSYEVKLQACAELLGHGDVVSLDVEGAPHYTDEGIRMCPPFSYANAGDTYAVTLARDHAASQWVIACWGDLLEEYEEENKLGDCEEFDEEPEVCPSCHRSDFTLTHFPGSARGPSYSWVCDSCNHHAFAAEGYEPGEGEEVECRDNKCAVKHAKAKPVTCAECGSTIKEGESWGIGEVGDKEFPSFCSKVCYETFEWDGVEGEPGDGTGDDDGDVPGTGDEP